MGVGHSESKLGSSQVVSINLFQKIITSFLAIKKNVPNIYIFEFLCLEFHNLPLKTSKNYCKYAGVSPQDVLLALTCCIFLLTGLGALVFFEYLACRLF